MQSFRKVMAAVLVMAMALSLVLTASAAESPVTAPVNPGYDAATGTDTSSADDGNTVVTKITGTSATITKVTGEKGKAGASKVTLKVAYGADNQPVSITKVGTGKAGVLDSKAGRRVTKVTISSTASKVTISKLAFKGSKVKSLTLSTGKAITIKKGAFNGTKVKNPKIVISGTKKTAADFTIKKGAFNGLNKKAKIVVKKGTMSAAEFQKLKKKLQKAGFKGSITRK